MNRRMLLKWLIVGTSMVAASVIAIPAFISAIAPAMGIRRQMWRPIGPLRQFPWGQVVLATVEIAPDDYPVKTVSSRSVYVWQRSETEVIVFSRTCTDLGCPVNYDPGSEFYYCPCHGGVFNKSGEPVAGPPARPLYQYATRVRDGLLEIDLRSVPPVA